MFHVEQSERLNQFPARNVPHGTFALWKGRPILSQSASNSTEYDSLVLALQSGIANGCFPNYAAFKSLRLRKT